MHLSIIFTIFILKSLVMLIHWLMARGLIAEGDVCSMCGVEMVLTITSCLDRSDGSKWECKRQDNGKRHKTEISIRKGSKKAKRVSC